MEIIVERDIRVRTVEEEMTKIYASFTDKIVCPKKNKSQNISKCERCDECNELGQNRKTLGYFVNCGWE